MYVFCWAPELAQEKQAGDINKLILGLIPAILLHSQIYFYKFDSFISRWFVYLIFNLSPDKRHFVFLYCDLDCANVRIEVL